MIYYSKYFKVVFDLSFKYLHFLIIKMIFLLPFYLVMSLYLYRKFKIKLVF